MTELERIIHYKLTLRGLTGVGHLTSYYEYINAYLNETPQSWIFTAEYIMKLRGIKYDTL